MKYYDGYFLKVISKINKVLMISFVFHSSNAQISYFAVRTNNKEYTHFEKRGVSFVLVSYFLPCEPFASVLNRTVPLTA